MSLLTSESGYAIPFTALLATVIVSLALFNTRVAKKKLPWVEERVYLGVPSKNKIRGTAVVCGGSIAGILTARSCADQFEKVIIVDPEFTRTLNGKPKTRLMQYNSFHVYLSPLMDCLRLLWPDFDKVMTDAGGIFGSAISQANISGIPVSNVDILRFLRPQPTTVHLRRPKFESSLQKLLVTHPTFSNIRVIDGTVRRIIRSEDGKSIASVIIRDLDNHSVTLDEVDMIADCTGSTQAGVKWLAAAEYKLPEDLRVSYDPKLSYMTISFTVSENLANTFESRPGVWAGNKSNILYSCNPHPSRGSMMFAISRMDKDTIQLLFGGWGVSDLPSSLDAIEPCLRTFKCHEPIPSWVFKMVEDIIEHGRSPTFEPAKTSPRNYVRYTGLNDLPSNYIAIGDSTMLLNPIYGQGCYKAMLGVLALNAILASRDNELLPRDLSRQYFKRLASRTQGLWDSSRFADYGYATTEPIPGETLATGRFARWFSAKMLSTSSKDGEVSSILWRVISLEALGTEFFSPRILWKILWTSSRFGS